MKATTLLSLASGMTIALGTVGLAQDGPAFDCAAAESSAEKLICDDPALAALDRRMATRFAAAVDVAQGLDVGSSVTEDLLRAYQRGWISGRDECWKQDDLRACVEWEYLYREGQLVAEFLLEPAQSVTEYTCDSGANLTVYAFPTELPSLRVEQGDSVGVGGAAGLDMPDTFYLRDMGTFVSSGDSAELTDPYGEPDSCRIAG